LLRRTPLAFDKSTGWGKVNRLLESLSGSMIDTYYLRLSGFSKKQKFDLFSQDQNQINQDIWNEDIYDYFAKHSSLPSVDQLMAVDQITHLPEYILTKTDISGMANGLEARAPFIDVEFIEWINKLPASFKDGNYSKQILKDILQESGVDKDIVHRKKAGFTPPLKGWMEDSNEIIKHFFLSEGSTLDFLNKDYLKGIFEYNVSNGYPMSNHLYTLLTLGIWLENV